MFGGNRTQKSRHSVALNGLGVKTKDSTTGSEAPLQKPDGIVTEVYGHSGTPESMERLETNLEEGHIYVTTTTNIS